MGNYYKRNQYCRWQKGGSNKGKKFLWGCVAVLLIVAAVCCFGDSSPGEALKTGKTAVTEAISSAVTKGSALLGGREMAFAVPVTSGVVVEKFGIVSDGEGQEAYHNGIDIRVPAESEVLAAADGKISDISTHDDSTVWITVAHQKNWCTVYGRLGKAAVAVGDEVKKGDVLGTPANEILHFEVLEKEIEKDPVRYLEKSAPGGNS